VKGIGKSIAAIIGELIQNGSSREHADLAAAVPPGLLDMLRIQGLGPKRIILLHKKLGIATLEQLEQAARESRLAAVEGFGKKTEENILKGIEALRSSSEKRLYPDAAEPARSLLEALRRRKETIRAEVAGSLRRRKEVIGDIDILVSAGAKSRPSLIQTFVTHPLVTSVLAQGETKSSVVLQGGTHADLRIVSDDEYPFALNYFTGSKEHNVALRGRAKKSGWSLNEYGFSMLDDAPRGTRKPPRCPDEEAIYRALGLAYVPPELREDLGEIEAAEKGTLPALVEEKDIRGTFHCHTTDSDGANTLDEMVQGAKALGWEYLGIADHSKGAAYAGGLTEPRVREQLRRIESLNARLKNFKVFAGTECDILPSGELDWPERVLSLFDYVVVSVHSNFRMDGREMTKRIVRAVSHKRVTMLGHPTGRLLLSREAYDVDMTQVIDAAADHGTMIEINAHPMRLDLDWRLCRYARDRGVTIVINPDAHNVDGLRDVWYGVGIARKGWLGKGDVLNTLPVRQVTARLKARS
jgi:DNA polymerase (family 10)